MRNGGNSPGNKHQTKGFMNLVDILQSAVKTDVEQYAQFGTVTAVDGSTCTVQPLNGDAPINRVKLSAGETDTGVVMVPVVDSVVLVVFSSKTRHAT